MNWHPGPPCIAIDHRGHRCCRPSFCAIPVTFSWDPVNGTGFGGPYATFCRMHDYWHWLRGPDRIEVIGGWMGAAWNTNAKVWTALTTIYEARDGLSVSRRWWGLRHETVIGDLNEETFDDAIARTARKTVAA